MDLNDFETKARSAAGVDIELLSLKGSKATGIFITILGVDGEVFETARDENARTLSAHMESGQQVTPELRVTMLCTLLAKCTTGWFHKDKTDGAKYAWLMRGDEKVEFKGFQSAMDLYMRHPGIREQINQAIVDRGNFVGA